MRGTGFLHIVRLLRANIEQEGGRSTVDETGDTFVHGLFPRCIERFLVYLLEIGLEETDYAFLWVVDILFPAILFREGVQCPKSLLSLCVVTTASASSMRANSCVSSFAPPI